MTISKDSRQMPSKTSIVREKNYCDLLYAWLQCNSERITIESEGRRINKALIKWAAIERDFTRILSDGTEEKGMSRKTIAKYFGTLEELGLIKLGEDGYYYLTVLDRTEANLIEYKTLDKLMNVLQKNSISIYVYLFNRYYANDMKPFVVTIKQIKDFIGIASTTTSNNAIIDDTIEILQRLGLLEMSVIHKNEKTMFQFNWVKNKLP